MADQSQALDLARLAAANTARDGLTAANAQTAAILLQDAADHLRRTMLLSEAATARVLAEPQNIEADTARLASANAAVMAAVATLAAVSKLTEQIPLVPQPPDKDVSPGT